MVDRRERRDLQDGKGKDRQSKCHVHYQRRGLGRDVERETQRHVGLCDWPAESPRQPSGGEKTRRDLPLESVQSRRTNPINSLTEGALPFSIIPSDARSLTDARLTQTRLCDQSACARSFAVCAAQDDRLARISLRPRT